MTGRHEEEQVLHVHLELVLDRRPVLGTLRAGGRVEERFVGWLGFLGALQRLSGQRAIDAGDPAGKETTMGHPVVHFEVIGKDAAKLQAYYAELFGWKIDTNNPLGYGAVAREGNTNPEGVGIGGGIASSPTPGYDGHVTFYVGVPDIEAALAKAEELGGQRVFGPAPVPGTDLELGQFTDPEGHLIGLMKAAS